MTAQQQNFGDFADSLSFYNSNSREGPKGRGYSMVSLQGCSPPSRLPPSKKPVVPGFLGNLLGGGSQDLGGVLGQGVAWGSSKPGNGEQFNPGAGMLPQPARDDERGLLQSGLSAVKDGASRVLDSANTMVNATRQSIAEGPLSSQNMVMFGITAAVGVVFMSLAFLTLPLLVFAPSKFALLFTMGSLCFLAALALLRGIGALARHLVEPARLPFTVAYFSSLFLTLYATLLAKSYLLTLVFSIMQMIGLSSFLVSYIPGGTQMIRFLGQAAWQVIRKACGFGDSREMALPL